MVLTLLVITSRAEAQMPSYIPGQDIIGWWSLDGHADDLSQNSNHGMLFGANPSTDRHQQSNSALRFESNDFIALPHDTNFSFNSFSLAFWIKPLNFIAEYEGLLRKSAFSPGRPPFYPGFQSGFNVYRSDSLVQFRLAADTIIALEIQIMDSSWNHIAFTIDSSTGSSYAYLNGIRVDSFFVQSFSARPNSSDFYVAKRNNAVSHGPRPPSPTDYEGDMDDLGIWGGVLSQAEIMALFGSTMTSIDELSKNDIEIWPNPNQGVFQVSGLNREIHQINLFDLRGSALQIKTEHTINNVQVKCEEFISGTYLVELSTESGTIVKKVYLEK